MRPIRVLLVDEPHPASLTVQRELETVGFDVHVASTPVAGMLSLARVKPDLLMVNPHAGHGTSAEWQRAIQRYRVSHSLAVLVIAVQLPPKERKTLAEVADLGVVDRPSCPGCVLQILAAWRGQEHRTGHVS